jgi:UrcA family protein
MMNQTTGGKNAVRVTWAILAAVSTTLVAGAIQAAESGDAPATQLVSYGDLNLSSPEGTERLYRRIQNAAERVCGQVDVLDLHAVALKKACINRAVSQAVAAVKSPMLTSEHPARADNSGQALLASAQTR